MVTVRASGTDPGSQAHRPDGQARAEILRKRLETAKVVELSVGEPVRPIHVEPRYRDVRLIVRDGTTVVGELVLPALAVLTPRMQIEAVARELGEALWPPRLVKLVEGSLPRQALPP